MIEAGKITGLGHILIYLVNIDDIINIQNNNKITHHPNSKKHS